MTRNNIMLKRLGAAAFSALLVWSMPGTSAFAEGVAEVAVQAQAQASQQADTAENADESSFTADEQTGAEGAEASADEASSEPLRLPMRALLPRRTSTTRMPMLSRRRRPRATRPKAG